MGDEEGPRGAKRAAWVLLLVPVGLVAMWLLEQSNVGEGTRGGRFGRFATPT